MIHDQMFVHHHYRMEGMSIVEKDYTVSVVHFSYGRKIDRGRLFGISDYLEDYRQSRNLLVLFSFHIFHYIQDV
jgi:hypothetical protein